MLDFKKEERFNLENKIGEIVCDLVTVGYTIRKSRRYGDSTLDSDRGYLTILDGDDKHPSGFFAPDSIVGWINLGDCRMDTIELIFETNRGEESHKKVFDVIKKYLEY